MERSGSSASFAAVAGSYYDSRACQCSLGAQWAIVDRSFSQSIGLVTKSSQPASRHFWRSSAMAWAVRAMIGRGVALRTEFPRGGVAVHDGHLHVHQDDVEGLVLFARGQGGFDGKLSVFDRRHARPRHLPG